MEHIIQIVEPDLLRGKQIARVLIRAGYDAFLASCADKALRQFFQVRPDAVILSDRLAYNDLDWLGKRIRALSDLPLIGFGDGVPLVLVTQRLGSSTEAQELLDTLRRVLEASSPADGNGPSMARLGMFPREAIESPREIPTPGQQSISILWES